MVEKAHSPNNPPAGTRGDVKFGPDDSCSTTAGRGVEPRDSSCCKMTRSARVIGRGEVTSISLPSGLWRVQWGELDPISGHCRHIDPDIHKTEKGEVAAPSLLIIIVLDGSYNLCQA